MPCYLKNIQVDLVNEIKNKAKGKQPTKAITRAVLKEALKNGVISTAKYSQLIAMVDACVEERGHVHEHEKVRV